MALSIATNTSALDAAAAAASVSTSLETSMERLSTGKRINSALIPRQMMLQGLQ